MFVLIRLNKRRAAHKAVGRDRAWLGLAAEDDITVMESPQPLVDHPLACDAVLTHSHQTVCDIDFLTFSCPRSGSAAAGRTGAAS